MPARERPRAARRRAARGDGERVGHELPGVVRQGPPVTITCVCGRKGKVRYGDTWTCDDCQRTWNTSRVPRREYDQIRNLQLRYRLLPIALGLLVASAAAFFILTGNGRGVFVLLPVALILWFVFVRPSFRRRYRNAIARRQKWHIQQER